jgi:hypothetical protein
MKHPSKNLGIAALTLATSIIVGLGSLAHADTTLISDSFDRGDGTTALDGSTADTGQTWTGVYDGGSPFVTSTASQNGIAGYTLGGNDGSSHNISELAFTPTSGEIYTLTAVLSITSPNAPPSNWIALGFDNGTALQYGTYGYGAYNATGPYIQFSGQDTNNLVAHTSPTGTSTTGSSGGITDQTLSIVLNTSNASDWTVSFEENGTVFDTYDYGASDAANISDIMIGTQQQPGYFQSLSLTEAAATPEPATWALMLGGLGLLAGIQHLRRKTASA